MAASELACLSTATLCELSV